MRAVEDWKHNAWQQQPCEVYLLRTSQACLHAERALSPIYKKKKKNGLKNPLNIMHNWARSNFCFAIYNVQLGEALLGEKHLTDDPLHHPGSWIQDWWPQLPFISSFFLSEVSSSQNSLIVSYHMALILPNAAHLLDFISKHCPPPTNPPPHPEKRVFQFANEVNSVMNSLFQCRE